MSDLDTDIEFYGLRGITHGGAKLLTVLATRGKSAINDLILERKDLLVYPGAGELVQFHEKRSGALDNLVRRYAIHVLNKDEWDEKKREVLANNQQCPDSN